MTALHFPSLSDLRSHLAATLCYTFDKLRECDPAVQVQDVGQAATACLPTSEQFYLTNRTWICSEGLLIWTEADSNRNLTAGFVSKIVVVVFKLFTQAECFEAQ